MSKNTDPQLARAKIPVFYLWAELGQFDIEWVWSLSRHSCASYVKDGLCFSVLVLL